MRLKEWIRGNGFTYQTFAQEIGASKRVAQVFSS